MPGNLSPPGRKLHPPSLPYLWKRALAKPTTTFPTVPLAGKPGRSETFGTNLLEKKKEEEENCAARILLWAKDRSGRRAMG